MWGAIASAVASAANSAYKAWSDHQNRKATKSLNSQMIELANTAHQREVADLKAAGINPLLTAGGSGASTPSLTAPSYDSSIGSEAINSANSVYNSYRQGQLASAQVTSAKTANEIQKKELEKQDYTISSAKSASISAQAQAIPDKIRLQAWKAMSAAEKQQVIRDVGSTIKLEALRGAVGTGGSLTYGSGKKGGKGNGSAVLPGLSDTAVSLTRFGRELSNYVDSKVKYYEAKKLSKEMKEKLKEARDEKNKVDVKIPKPRKVPVDYKPKFNSNDYYRYTSPHNAPVYRP